MLANSIAIIANSKHKKKLKRLKAEIKIEAVKHLQCNIELFESSSQSSVKTLTYKAAEKYQVLVAVGGDGTLHEVLNGIFAAHKEDSCILGFIPAGSANDFHKTLKGADSLKDIIYKLKNDKYDALSVGKLDYLNDKGTIETRYFINIASLGMGYDVMQQLNKSSKKLGANLAYFFGILKTFFTYQNIQISCKANDWQWEGKIKSMAVANGKYFGSGLCIAPHANPLGNTLAITIIGNISLWTYLKKILPLKMGKYIKHQEVIYKETEKITINSSTSCGIEADGEVLGTTPATFNLLPNKIRLL